MPKRRVALGLLGLLGSAAVAIGLAVGMGSKGSNPWPEEVSLPSGFQPEGIAAGPGTSFFVGSIPTGAVYRGDVATGEGAVVVAGRPGRSAIGLEEADGRLFVAGGATGRAFIYDSRSGRDVAAVLLGSMPPTFVNDVVVTATAAFFTDSLNPVIYRVDRATLEVTPVALTGDIAFAPGFNTNGIEATLDDQTLVIVQTNTGRLFTVDAMTGSTRRIELADGGFLPGGDGLLLTGRTLHVVQNIENQVTVVRLDADLTVGTVLARIADPRFDAPTTVTAFGDRLYVVNARIALADPAAAAYQVVAVPRP